MGWLPCEHAIAEQSGSYPILDLNHNSGLVPGREAPAAPALDPAAEVNARIAIALLTKARQDEPRDYLGASIIGEPCDRKLYFSYTHAPSLPFSAQVQRIFAAGHLFENQLVYWLRLAGFDLRDRDPRTGKQFEFWDLDGRFGGHCDGIIAAGPTGIGLRYPLLWEAKSLNDKSWRDLERHGVRKSKPVYYSQVQIYLGYLDLETCLFSAINKNTSEIFHEVLAFDRAEAQRCADRAAAVIRAAEAGDVPPRIGGADLNRYPCQYCQFKEHCWDKLYDPVM